MILKGMISTSLKSSKDGKEQGENPLIEISLSSSVDDQEASRKFTAILGELDHHHLSEDSNLGIKSYEDLAPWLDKRLKAKGLSSKRITVQVNKKLSFTLV